MTRTIVVVLAVGLAIGCGDDDGVDRRDASSGIDAGSGSDAGASDDASTTIDAATSADASGGDASTSADGGTSGDATIDGGLVSMPCTASGACDPFDPTSCGESACRRGASGTECRAITTPVRGAGETCTRNDECAAGTLCLNFGDGFHCERMCPEGSIGFCGDGHACSGTIGDACIRVCRPIPAPCDIYAQDCADAADTCTLATHPETRAPYTACRTAGTRARGETCGGEAGTCGHDLICIRTGDTTACRQPCDPEAAVDECTTGESCTGMARTWMVGFCAPVTP
ncbi:hypothetical protein [Sandaracinus amylolyticus]|nr:hypothetical protein [Sandaracinus amylolyticus]